MRPEQGDEEERGLGQASEEASENERKVKKSQNRISTQQMTKCLKVQERGTFRPAYQETRGVKTDEIASELKGQEGQITGRSFSQVAQAGYAFEKASFSH